MITSLNIYHHVSFSETDKEQEVKRQSHEFQSDLNVAMVSYILKKEVEERQEKSSRRSRRM